MHSYVHCGTVYNSKDQNQPKCLLIIDWTRKIWHIYTMEYYAAIKNDDFMPFVGIWMNLETIILRKLTQEQKIKHCMFSLIGGGMEAANHITMCVPMQQSCMICTCTPEIKVQFFLKSIGRIFTFLWKLS